MNIKRDQEHGVAVDTDRLIRILAILAACDRVGLQSVNLSIIHTIAFLTDALAPVWDLPMIDAQVLKRRVKPFSPVLQRGIDSLVGSSLLHVDRFEYTYHENEKEWAVDADYSLNRITFGPVMTEIERHPEQSRKVEFVREVVYAASGLGVLGMAEISKADATYSNPIIDVGGLINMANEADAHNPTARVAHRFAELGTRTGRKYSDAEMVHLYVRHLYKRMRVA